MWKSFAKVRPSHRGLYREGRGGLHPQPGTVPRFDLCRPDTHCRARAVCIHSRGDPAVWTPAGRTRGRGLARRVGSDGQLIALDGQKLAFTYDRRLGEAGKPANRPAPSQVWLAIWCDDSPGFNARFGDAAGGMMPSDKSASATGSRILTPSIKESSLCRARKRRS